MSTECSECERDARGPHDPSCSIGGLEANETDSLAETCRLRSIEHKRALKNLERHGFEGAVCIICSFISIDRLKEMNDFWEASDPQCSACNRPEAMCSADPCPAVVEDRKS